MRFEDDAGEGNSLHQLPRSIHLPHHANIPFPINFLLLPAFLHSTNFYIVMFLFTIIMVDFLFFSPTTYNWLFTTTTTNNNNNINNNGVVFLHRFS